MDDDDLPIVARMVVEIRSDGRRTIARGAAEDPEGNRVAIEAQGDSPLSLAIALSRSMLKLPGSVLRTSPRRWLARARKTKKLLK